MDGEYSDVINVVNQRLSAVVLKEADVAAAVVQKDPEAAPPSVANLVGSDILANKAMYLDHRLHASHTLRRRPMYSTLGWGAR